MYIYLKKQYTIKLVALYKKMIKKGQISQIINNINIRINYSLSTCPNYVSLSRDLLFDLSYKYQNL